MRLWLSVILFASLAVHLSARPPRRTSFDCSAQEFPAGYYADVEARCQVFHICQSDGRSDAFLCPVGTIFNQRYFVCDWWQNVNCDEAPNYYNLNGDLYKPGPSPETPEPAPPSDYDQEDYDQPARGYGGGGRRPRANLAQPSDWNAVYYYDQPEQAEQGRSEESEQRSVEGEYQASA
ncbi:hypothetical protein HPB49_017748 [Dermacentor silvarum]|uniref:Uncharacterized protein n=1 Tax=Dermacentor silvarum TaxID=543639 RepID=A0ACB8CAM4_DERSI|nr:hypothetical protein HPB49_017748 [Dermacentor silvarum]